MDPNAGGYGLGVFPQHQAKLASSAVAVDVARERGYVTADTKAGLERYGFSPAQRRPPALVIPVRDVFGEVAGYQLRSDDPRVLDGRTMKYESRLGQKMVLDVPPRVHPHLGDPSRALLVTEGPIKADSLVSAGLDAVALLGVWGWRGTNDEGGRVALAAWEQVALNGRQIYLAFDSDVMLKLPVYEAMSRFGTWLRLRGAEVAYIYLPSENGQKVGADDFLANGGSAAGIVALAEPELRRLPGDPSAAAAPADTFDDVADEPGWQVLDDLRDWLAAHVAYQSPHHAATIALWCAHTHAFDHAASTPRITFESPEPESGKSRNLELIEPVARHGHIVLQPSSAAFYRWIKLVRPTIELDEADTVFGPRASKDHEDLRGIINAGHRPGATIPRVDKDTMQVENFPCFAPVALAGISGFLPDTLRSRAIRIPMRRRAPDEIVRHFRERITRPEGTALGRRLAAWVARHGDTIPETPELPDGVTDQQADQWEPLIAIADAAGGDWPATARAACSAISSEARANTDDQSLGIRLLGDIHKVLGDADRMTTAGLLDKLHGLDDAPWGDLRGKPITARWLAGKLRPYGVKPDDHRFPEGTRKGYLAADFHEVWPRYAIPAPKGNKGNMGNVPARSVAHVAHVAHGTSNGHCEVCGLAMTVLEPGQTAHPLCVEGGDW